MTVQGYGGIIIVYCGLIFIAAGAVLFITKFWNAIISGDAGFVLFWCTAILVSALLYAGCGLLVHNHTW